MNNDSFCTKQNRLSHTQTADLTMNVQNTLYE